MDREEPIYIYDLPDDEVKKESGPAWRRGLAFALDLVIFYFVFFQIFFMIYSYLAGIPVGGTAETYTRFILNDLGTYQKLVTGLFASGFLMLFYFVVSEKYMGASLGEKIFKLKVVSTDNTKLGFGRLIVRNLTKSILLPLMIIDLVPIFFTKTKQRYTEWMSRTKVLYGGKLELVYEGYV